MVGPRSGGSSLWSALVGGWQASFIGSRARVISIRNVRNDASRRLESGIRIVLLKEIVDSF